MDIDYQVGVLNQTTEGKLADHLGGAHLVVVKNLIQYLISIGVTSYLIESRYIDRDYSSDYRRFYSQTFRTYERQCQRIHFFSEDISPILSKASWAERVRELQNTSRRSYCGFCVRRPLPTAPIGRTVLLARCPGGPGLEPIITCRADIRANLLGAELDVSATSFMQQDARVGACAQVAIWTGARHMHQRYKYNWLSVADITRLAAPTTAEEATSLPAGSDFLTSERMIRAIHEMGFQPLCVDGSGTDIGAAIVPYVESGLPVILGLQFGGGLGHAVTVIGRVFSSQSKPTNQLADYVSAFVVHDDQAGPYMLLPRSSKSVKKNMFDPRRLLSKNTHQGKKIDLDVAKHAVFAVALMPVKAFSTARAAEKTAIGRLDAAMKALPTIRSALKNAGVPVNSLLDELLVAHGAERIVLRTYLTSAAGYRKHIAQGTACDDLKDEALRLHLPHFTWITEISTIDSYNQASPGFRRIYGHSILDATSSGKDQAGLLAFHLPGLFFKRDVNHDSETVAIIGNDTLYEAREKKVGA